MQIKERISRHHAEITGWRRKIHENPELGYDLPETAAFVAAKLREFGCDEVVEAIGRTGVVGVIHGRNNTKGSCIGLRADMDALPMPELTGLDYASRVPGRMHACGHDGHTAMLLGAARYLAETRDFDGQVVLIFQPAEEDGAGAEAMIRDGLLERFPIAEVYAMHNHPGLPVGQFATRSGPFHAAADEFAIDIIGKGGHAAKPHTIIDPTIVASHLVLALQTIVSRNADPMQSIVLSVTSFRTESDAYNVIPERIQLRGTVRTYDPALRALAEERLRQITSHTASMLGATAVIDWQGGYPPMINTQRETDFARGIAGRVSGLPVVDAPAIMGAEDFAYMLEQRPGAFIQIGNGDTADVHNPAYDFNDAAIPYGASYWAELVETRMPLS